MRQLASAVFVYSGFSRYARRLHRDQPCILMFHGVREVTDHGLLDVDLHLEEGLFADVCEHLARHFHVTPLQDILSAVMQGKTLPSGTVALTFDDGYASNHHLAFPILKRLGLPATIFPATGFIDKTELPWFLRLEFAVAKSRKWNVHLEVGHQEYASSLGTEEERHVFLGQLLRAFKAVPQEQVVPLMVHVEAELDCAMQGRDDWPDIFQPMSWDEARELRSSGLIDFGGHTHRHLILSRCREETARQEIRQCRERVTQELGVAPLSFAYPNGQKGDHNDTTARLLHEEGFNLAVTTESGFVRTNLNAYELPRHGSPVSSHHAEATISGAFETFKQWRKAPFRIPRPAWS
jgi:peptidoglycan/xylan/chitin deacetylase (PgdA/CDA1 family)